MKAHQLHTQISFINFDVNQTINVESTDRNSIALQNTVRVFLLNTNNSYQTWSFSFILWCSARGDLFAIGLNGGRKAWKAVTTIPAWQNEVRDDDDADDGDNAADGDDDNGDKIARIAAATLLLVHNTWQDRNWDKGGEIHLEYYFVI